MTWALSLSGICLFQRSLSSLELPRVVSVANGTSSISASSVPSIEDSDKINGDNHVGSLRLSEYSGKQRQKSHDPRDLSIQVLEKFSLVTKFARETTSHLFRENYSDSFNAYDTKQQVPSLPANAPDKGPGDTEKDLTEAPVASDPLEVSLDLYFYLVNAIVFGKAESDSSISSISCFLVLFVSDQCIINTLLLFVVYIYLF